MAENLTLPGLFAGFEASPKRRKPKREPKREPKRVTQVASYGGGVDSFCMLLDAIDRGEKPDALVFMDVGDPQGLDPAEWPDTYRHLREVVIPLANREGIPFYWLATGPGLKVKGAKVEVYPIRPGALVTRSLSGWMRGGARSGGIQVPTAKSRACTSAAKVERFEKWMVDHHPNAIVRTWIGFDASESHRIKPGRDPHAGRTSRAMGAVGVSRDNRFPLMERNLDRKACKALIKAHGYEVPPKSACVFCPFSEPRELLELLRREPELFKWIEEWESARRKKPTASNVIMSIFGFETFKLSAARLKVLRKLADRGALTSGERRQQLPWLIEVEWASPDGARLTKYGRAILRAWEAGPDKSSDHWTSAQGVPKKPVSWPVRKAAGKSMELGIHYQSPELRGYLEKRYPSEMACILADEETALAGALVGISGLGGRRG